MAYSGANLARNYILADVSRMSVDVAADASGETTDLTIKSPAFSRGIASRFQPVSGRGSLRRCGPWVALSVDVARQSVLVAPSSTVATRSTTLVGNANATSKPTIPMTR